ncbi:MAG: AAA family ATPase [Bacilli bacterium]|nr:AAA family ATPase [Bacilli bacterium]
MQSLFISRVVIKNFRNFKNVDIQLSHKGIIIGENNVGKTNFLRALQLILDPSLSDDDRSLNDTDFNDTIENPVEHNEEILIQVYISNFSDNKTILAMLNDAIVIEGEEEKILLTYRYFPYEYEDGKKEYIYTILKGNPEHNKDFTFSERKYLNLKVIKPLRDVETELKNYRISPINKILKEYNFDPNDLEEIASSFSNSSDKILSLDEIKDITRKLNMRFSEILGNDELNITFGTQEIDPNKIISSMKIMLANRNINDISLGLNNIVYISLMIQLLQDTTIPSLLKKDKYDEFSTIKGFEIINDTYTQTEKGNYVLNTNIDNDKQLKLHNFMDENNSNNKGVTLLAIEEPEAHLHPIYQRLIYKDIIQKNSRSVLMTTHSTHITSISPINTIIHLHSTTNDGTKVNTSALLNLGDDGKDVERYLDIKRGEIYLSKGVILVEGVTEEYLIPQYAKLMNKPLDEKGIIVCNINSTNFKPYAKLLKNLNIPYIIITDGDFYCIEKDSEGKEIKKFHILDIQGDSKTTGYLGVDIADKIINDGIEEENKIEVNRTTAKEYGIFIGKYTFETDMMETSLSLEAKEKICNTFNSLTDGGQRQKNNFASELDSGQFIKCLSKIEANGIGKGRFAQLFSENCILENISSIIVEAIEAIYQRVDEY